MGKLFCSFIVAVIISLCYADPVGKHWPDISCHDYWENDLRERGPREHKATWEKCQIRNNDTGPCAKVCMLREYEILYEKGFWPSDRSKKATAYNGGETSRYVTLELGLTLLDVKDEDLEAKRKEYRKIADPISVPLNKCAKKFGSQYLERNIWGPCSEWTDLLDCLDKSFGCGSSEFKHT